MTASFDIAIVGGGLAGCSTALHACRMGGSAVLLERGRCGAQASGVNYGGVRQQGRHSAELALSRRSRSIWGNLHELVGSDCEFRVTGHLKLARDETDMDDLLVHKAELHTHGIEADLLGAADLRRRFPYVAPTYAGGSFCAEDGQANPRLVAPAFARAAAALGADIRECCAVDQIEVSDQGFLLWLRGDPVPVRARRLVNTAGAWGAAIAALLGDYVDETVMAPNMAVTEPIAPLIGPNLGICGGGIYIRQTRQGSVVFGSGLGVADRDRLKARPLADVTREAARSAIAMVPQLANVLLVRTWTGIEGRMTDGLPVVGPSPRVKGLFHAFGFSGHGFQLGPAVGAVLAELSLCGHSPTDIDGLSMSRFEKRSAASPAAGPYSA
ncbi:sarcosine oxidase subunit beta [Rhizobium sp. BK650]|uniref:NAD(P)/FAD-dependent oxidoreductase n=1 Tax=Rhizobium sp. BK650 TaxID=2586990 RepID=UPI0016169C79|nr:FAD-dependent oxidoreductase [Rhizobium sp. BK650]MBB3659730.1 sarcosine oxidase subunit beta [Rhizobium sp. BK650]